jgi:hypothetical protein
MPLPIREPTREQQMHKLGFDLPQRSLFRLPFGFPTVKFGAQAVAGEE